MALDRYQEIKNEIRTNWRHEQSAKRARRRENLIMQVVQFVAVFTCWFLFWTYLLRSISK